MWTIYAREYNKNKTRNRLTGREQTSGNQLGG